MAEKSKSSSGFLFILAGLGVASSLVVLFALRVFSQREGGDQVLVSNDYLQVQQIAAIKTIRKAMAEEFVDTVVDCISPQSLQNQILTEPQVAERVMAALETFSMPSNSSKTQKCERRKNDDWTFTLPCKLTINRSPAWIGKAINLGDINICGTTIAADIHSALGNCANAASFSACLVKSVLADNDVQKEIDKTVDVQKMNSQ